MKVILVIMLSLYIPSSCKSIPYFEQRFPMESISDCKRIAKAIHTGELVDAYCLEGQNLNDQKIAK